jgi:hypothetical protein
MDTLGYRPNLETDQKVNNETKEYFEIDYYENDSIVLKRLKENSPSLVLDRFSELNEKTKNKIKSLEKELNKIKVGDITFQMYKLEPDKYSEYLESSRNDLNNNTKIEVYDLLVKELTKNKSMEQLYSKVMFGEEPPKETEEAHIKILEQLEKEDKKEKINYAVMNSDIKVVNTIMNYTTVSSLYVDNLISIDEEKVEYEKKEKNKYIEKTINNIFEKNKKQVEHSLNSYKINESKNVLEQNIKNIINNRNNFSYLLKAKKDLPFRLPVVEYYNKLNESIINFNKNVYTNGVRYNNIANALKDKDDTRSLYKSLF